MRPQLPSGHDTPGIEHAVLRAASYLDEHSAWLIERPIRIAITIVVALIVRFLVHRAIDKLTLPARSGRGRLLGLLPQRVRRPSFLESAGLLSERRAQRAAAVGSVLKSVVSFVIFILAALLILGELDVDLAPFIAGTSIVGVAVAFGAQSLVKDFLSGIFMILEDQYGVGDVIDFDKASGTVEAVGLRTTRLRDEHGTVWYVRNGEVVKVGNKSQGYAQVVVDVPLPASADVEATSRSLLAVARDMHADEDWEDMFLGEPELQGVESFTRDETVLRLVARVRPLSQWRVGRELRRRIRERLPT